MRPGTMSRMTNPHTSSPASTTLTIFNTHAEMRGAGVLSALETTFVILAALIQCVVYATVITCVVTLLCVLFWIPFMFTAKDADRWVNVVILCISGVLSTISSLKVGARWYRWLRDRRRRRSAVSEAHASLPEPPGGACPSSTPEAGGQPPCPQNRCRAGRPPSPSMAGCGVAPRTPLSGGSAETGVESLNHELEALPSLTPPMDSHSGHRSLAAVLFLPCNHIAPCPAVSDMRSVTTCPVCGGGAREAIRQAQT
ncbi:hypothetical protein DFP73DRAFT_211329 [Morchella snyderi]|nr:hypothetical protein DFP73DRAFT_211329 [Morchella snyderi]